MYLVLSAHTNFNPVLTSHGKVGQNINGELNHKGCLETMGATIGHLDSDT